MPHFDFHAGSDFRLFSEIEFDYEDGRNGGPRFQIDEDSGDVHQVFIEIAAACAACCRAARSSARRVCRCCAGSPEPDNDRLHASTSFIA
jgi:hypothetical protein